MDIIFDKHTKALHKRIEKMIRQMQENPKNLEAYKIEWVNKIASTAAEFESGGFSNRQCEVINDIYKAYKQCKKHKPSILKDAKRTVIQGEFK